MQLKNLHESVGIFLKYYPEEHLGGAGHDELYGPGYDEGKMTDEDEQIVKNAGWFVSEDYNAWVAFC